MFVDDAFGDGEPEPGAFEPLGGVEGLEDPGEFVFFNARAVVDDGDGGGGAEHRAGDIGIGSRFVEGDADGDDAEVWFDGFDGVGEQIHQCLMKEVWIDHDRGHLWIGVDDQGDAFFLALFFEELGAVVSDGVEAGEFEFELEFSPEGEHVDGERCDAIEVSPEDSPAVLCDGEVVFVEPDLDDIGAASESLEDVFD